MSNAEWTDEGQVEAKKKRVPSWVWWGCGSGCLLATIAIGGMAFFGARLVRESMDPEKQWPRLQRVMAFEERPPGLEIELGLSLGADQFHLVDSEQGLRATLIEFPPSSHSEYEQFLDPEIGTPFGLGQPVEPESGTLLVQGREVRCLRFARIKPEGEGNNQGAGIRIDLTGERLKPRTLELRSSRAERIDDALVAEFLTPFDVWKEQ